MDSLKYFEGLEVLKCTIFFTKVAQIKLIEFF